MPFIVAVPVAYLFVAGSSREVLIGLLAVSAHGYVGAYLLVCLATPAFLHRIGELSRTPLIVGLATGRLMMAIIVWAALTVDVPCVDRDRGLRRADRRPDCASSRYERRRIPDLARSCRRVRRDRHR